MGRAGDLLARLLKTFIRLSVPKVNLFEGGELHMTLSHVTDRDNVHAVTQGFVARGLAGEAVLIFSDSSFEDIGRLLNYPPPIDATAKTELLMDIANLLTGACLKGISEQLQRPFSEGRPVILGRNTRLEEMLNGKHNHWRSTLAAEVSYEVEGHNINCELLLLFTADSLPALDQQLAQLGMRR
jgi:chemotaxis protein CheY-P-specific phosphatase CheC